MFYLCRGVQSLVNINSIAGAILAVSAIFVKIRKHTRNQLKL